MLATRWTLIISGIALCFIGHPYWGAWCVLCGVLGM